LDSWSRERRVAAKAEWTGGGANPRFLVTSLSRAEHQARHLYEKLCCARGEMENRIRECQLDLFADRTSAATMRTNQLRLWFAARGAFYAEGAIASGHEARRIEVAKLEFRYCARN
jgi:hypothetical protein